MVAKGASPIIAGEPEHLRIARLLGFETSSEEQVKFDRSILALTETFIVGDLENLVRAAYGDDTVEQIRIAAGNHDEKLVRALKAKANLGLFERRLDDAYIYNVCGVYGFDIRLAHRLYPQFELNRAITNRPRESQWFFDPARRDFYFRPGPTPSSIEVLGRLQITGDELNGDSLKKIAREDIHQQTEGRAEVLDIEILEPEPFSPYPASRTFRAIVRSRIE